jgi:hypothetical protein
LLSTGQYLSQGLIKYPTHGFAIGNYYYLSQTVAGTFTNTIYTTGLSQRCFFVVDADTLLIDVQPVIVPRIEPVFAKTVYFNSTTPSTATIFALVNPPLVNDPLLASDSNNIYIGSNGSTWTYNAGTSLYNTFVSDAATLGIIAGTTSTSQKIRLADGTNSDIDVDNLFATVPTKNTTGKIILSSSSAIENLTNTGIIAAWNSIVTTDNTTLITAILPDSTTNDIGKSIVVKNNGTADVMIQAFGLNILTGQTTIQTGTAVTYTATAIGVVTSTSSIDQAGATITLDRISVSRASSQNTALSTGDHVAYDQINYTENVGNIVLDTTTGYTGANNVASVGRFTLKAGYTYAMRASVAATFTTIGAALAVSWVNSDTGAVIGNTMQANNFNQGLNQNNNAIVDTIFKPTVDTRVEVRFSNAIAVSFISLSWATIEQLPNSVSIPVGTTAMNDQTATSYFDVGAMRIQWGKTASIGDNDQTITFPVSFATPPSVTCNIVLTTGTNAGWGVGLKTVTSSSFLANRDDSIADTAFFHWIAIGQKP